MEEEKKQEKEAEDDGELDFTLVSHLEMNILQQLYSILDLDDVWENIAPYMPGIQMQDVEVCKRQIRVNMSPTQLLFRVWSAKGYTVDHLYQLFAKTKLVRCMRIIQPFVNPDLHYLEDRVLNPVVKKPAVQPKPKKRRKKRKPNPDNEGQDQKPGPSRPSPREKLRTAAPIALHQQPTINPRPAVSSLLAYRTKATEPVPRYLQQQQQQQQQQQLQQSPKLQQHAQPQTINLSELTATTASNLSNDDFPIRTAIEGTLPVSYGELEAATGMFSSANIIGKGGYGVVYRGELRAGGTVAVKRIMPSNSTSGQAKKMERERLRQSLQELKTLARFRHDNILPIYAYCLEGPEPCLVYQFMANGSLEDRLLCRKMTAPLTWTQKMEISLGTARGLHFLHTIAKTPIIHGDIKTANILLDKHMEPKLGDFGLSRDGQMEAEAAEKTPLIASHIKGTLAYLPPEFVTSKILSTKLDVFSFGIVLCEIATGLRAYSDAREPRGLIEFCEMKKEDAKNDLKILREKIVDKRTPDPKNDNEKEAFNVLIELGLKSSNRDRLLRPNMDHLVDVLAASLIPKIEKLAL